MTSICNVGIYFTTVNHRNYFNIFKLCRRYLFQSHLCNQESQVVYLNEKFKTKKKLTEDDGQNFQKEGRPSLVVTEDNQYELLNELVTPLWKIPYEEQLKMKWRYSRHVLNQFCTSKRRSKCNLEYTISSPITEGYRNKSEMNVRKGIDGNDKTVGCFIGAAGVDSKSVICVPPKNLINTSEKHKQITQLFQDFIRSSPLPAMHDLFDGGFWRRITIRTNNETGDTMVIVVVHPQNYTPKEVYSNVLKLRQFFDDSNANITSLYYQTCTQTRCSNEIAPYKLISGEPYLTETLFDYKFRISPDSFFQINKLAAELLYKTVIEEAELKPNSVVLDLCCGTGSISILCSPYVRSCVGIDIMPQAIADARENAKLNNVSNCLFAVGRIEEALPKVLKALDYSSDVVAILNPSRNGVGSAIIEAIRSCKQISRVIYISCKADAPNSIKNFHDLSNSRFCTGHHFQVTNMTPVDLFPHTHHCEIILRFER